MDDVDREVIADLVILLAWIVAGFGAVGFFVFLGVVVHWALAVVPLGFGAWCAIQWALRIRADR